MSEFSRRGALALLVSAALFAGCQTRLGPEAFIHRYEDEGAVTITRNGFKMVLLYQSPEYLAATQGGEQANAATLDSLTRAYSQGHYFRISLRPSLTGKGRMETDADLLPADLPAIQAAMGQQLQLIQPELRKRIRLEGKNGFQVEPLSASFQKGILTGASNTILVVFPKEYGGKIIDPRKYELVIDDLGLNFGTYRRKLPPPKGLRLKVAA